MQFGPLLLSPLSEMYGRRIILNLSTSFFVLFQIGCALAPNLSALIVFRLLTGIGGSACLTIGGGVVSDLFEPEERGMAMSIFSAGPLFGPVLGPICGGFIAQRAGWRWVSKNTFCSIYIPILTHQREIGFLGSCNRRWFIYCLRSNFQP